MSMQERRLAVVMFADLRGFTRMIVNLEPHEAILVLNEHFSAMTKIVYDFEGTIFDLAGDELMVGFNVPIEQPDAFARSVETAIHMQSRFNQLRHRIRELIDTDLDLGLGIGIDEGHVVVGNVGAEKRMNFAMVGEAVNTAHRYVDLADDGQIVISAGIYEYTKQHRPDLLESQPLTPMGPTALKGKAELEELFKIECPRTPL